MGITVLDKMGRPTEVTAARVRVEILPEVRPASGRATLTELLEFANAVREAGGGNPLDALMPAVPEDATQCLIAKNLNFNCEVNDGPAGQWVMETDAETAEKIAEKLGLERYGSERVLLPAHIGQVAADFDEALRYVDDDYDEETDECTAIFRIDDPELFALIDLASCEAYQNATIINKDGSIVV